MRRSYVSVNGEWVPKEEYYANLPASGLQIIPDIKPYQSMVTGEMIMGRAQHREHLKIHNVIEVGNELDNPKPRTLRVPGGLKETIARAIEEKTRRR